MNALVTADTAVIPEIPSRPEPESDRIRALLEGTIRQGQERASQVLDAIERDQPHDQIVRASAVQFEADPRWPPAALASPGGSSGVRVAPACQFGSTAPRGRDRQPPYDTGSTRQATAAPTPPVGSSVRYAPRRVARRALA